MCQFTERDPIKRPRPGTRCRYTDQVAGADGCGSTLLLLLPAAALVQGVLPGSRDLPD